jgi:hypothetical protein
MGYLVLEEKIGRHITAFGEVVEEVKRAQQANYDEMQHDRILHWLTPIDQSSDWRAQDSGFSTYICSKRGRKQKATHCVALTTRSWQNTPGFSGHPSYSSP